MRAGAMLAVLAISRVAAADGAIEPSDSREAAMRYDFRPVRSDELGLRWRLDAIAAGLASTGSDTQLAAAGSVGALVGVTASPDCDLVSLGGQLAMRTDDRVLAATQTASLCLLGGSGKPPSDGHISIDHRLEWSVRPRLLAPFRLRPGYQRRETVGLDFAGSHVPFHERGPQSAVPNTEWLRGGELRLETEVGWSDTGGPADVRIMFDVIEFREYRKDYPDGPPLTIAVLAPRLDALVLPGDALDRTNAGLAADLARVEGVRVGDVRLGGRLGGRVAVQSRGQRATYAQQANVVGEAGVSAEHDLAPDFTMRLAGDRRSWPAFDTRLVVDDRATWSLAYAREPFRAHLDLFAARTHVLDIGARKDFTIGGAVADADLDVGKGFSLGLHSEAGRSVYALGAILDQPRWASETMLMLATHAGSH
ncbi:MAG: hypothetical protein ACM31C_12455 [Acidobacteriota bacterium]